MPVNIDTIPAEATATSTASVGVTFTIAANSNRCLIGMGVCDTSTAPAMSTMTWGADAMTEFLDSPSGFFGVYASYLVAPAAENRTMTMTLASSQDDLALCAFSLYDVDQATPVGTARTNSAASGDAWVGCADGDAADLAVGFCVFFNSTANALTPWNSAPKYTGVGAAVQSAGATTLTPGAVTGAGRGDIDVACIATENNNAISTSSSGWSQLGSTVQQDATWQQAVFVRAHDGTNVDPVFTWTGSVGCSARRFLISDANPATPTGTHSTNSGTGTTHSITGINATADNSTVVYIEHCEANTRLGADAGYTERFDAGSATGPYNLAVGTREQLTSGAGADNFSATGGNASWVMRLIEFLAGTAQTQRQEVEQFGVTTDTSASWDTEPGATYNTFGWTSTGNGGWRAAAFVVNAAAAAAGISNRTPFLTHIADNPIFQSRVIN